MNAIALKMLIGNRGKFFGIVLRLTFPSLLIKQRGIIGDTQLILICQARDTATPEPSRKNNTNKTNVSGTRVDRLDKPHTLQTFGQPNQLFPYKSLRQPANLTAANTLAVTTWYQDRLPVERRVDWADVAQAINMVNGHWI